MTTITIPPDDTVARLRADVAGMVARIHAETSPLALLAATILGGIMDVTVLFP